MADVIQVGKYTLESLTTGMYSDPKIYLPGIYSEQRRLSGKCRFGEFDRASEHAHRHHRRCGERIYLD